MTDDIVIRLREQQYGLFDETELRLAPIVGEAADEIERLRKWNTEITKLLQQAQVCMDIWQKSEDELIEFHNGKAIEQLTKQANEIERLRKDVAYQARVISRHYEQFASMRREIARLTEEATRGV